MEKRTDAIWQFKVFSWTQKMYLLITRAIFQEKELIVGNLHHSYTPTANPTENPTT